MSSRNKKSRSLPNVESLESRLLMDGWFGPQNALAIANSAAVCSLAAGDFNGDGKTDLISVDLFAGKVNIFRNRGDSTFTIGTLTVSADHPAAVVVGDINGDGKPDAVVSTDPFPNDTGTFTRYINNGSGVLTAQTADEDGSFTSMTLADLNGDGSLDLVAASRLHTNIKVFFNNGNGAFTSSVTVSAIAQVPEGVAVTDIDGDGKPDIVATTWGDGKVGWYKNNGNETFGALQVIDTTSNPYGLVTADIDGDGKMDVVAASSGNNTVSWYGNDGAGHFTKHVVSSTLSGALIVSAADLDGDGDMDIAAAGTGGKLVAYRNTGGGAFAAEEVIATSMKQPAAIQATDLNNDGFLDLAVDDSVSVPNVSWYENKSYLVVDSGPEIQVTDSSGPGDDLAVTLPTTRVNGTSAPAIFTLANRGSQPLNISNFAVGGADVDQFVVTVKDDLGQAVAGNSFSIPSGYTYTVEVVMAPTNLTPVNKAASITFNTNDPDDNEGTITLTMDGTARPISDPPADGVVTLERAVMKNRKFTGTYTPLGAGNFTGLDETVRITTSGWTDDMGNKLNFEYYLDTNNNGVIDEGVDQLLGSANNVNRTDNWGASLSSASWTKSGLQRIMVRAQDTDGVWSDPVSATLTFADYVVRQGRTALISDGLGGTAKASFSGPGEAGFIKNAAGGFDVVGVSGTTIKSSLTVSKSFSAAVPIQVRDIQVGADMKAFKATGMTLAGDFQAGGFVPTVSLAGVQNGTLTMGGTALQAWSFTTGAASGFSIDSSSVIKSLKAPSWTGVSTVAAPTLTKMTIAGWLRSTDVVCGNIGTVSVGGIDHSRVLAGTQAVNWLPTAAAEFVNATSYIKSFKNTGKAVDASGYSFIDSVVAAPNVLGAAIVAPKLEQGVDDYGVSASVLLKSVSVKYLNNGVKTTVTHKNVLPTGVGDPWFETLPASNFTISVGTT